MMMQIMHLVTILVFQGYGSSQTVEKPLKQTSDTIMSSDQGTCSTYHGDTPGIVWNIIILIYSVLVVIIVILLLVIRKLHKIILKQNRNNARQRDSSGLSCVTEDAPPVEAISPVSLSSIQANDDYEQMLLDNSAASGQIDSSTAGSYYNLACDPPDHDTAVQQCNGKRDGSDLSANLGVVPSHYQELVPSEQSNDGVVSSHYQELVPSEPSNDGVVPSHYQELVPSEPSNDGGVPSHYQELVPSEPSNDGGVPSYYQELVPSEPSNGQGAYQELCPVTKGPGNYASLGGSAVQEYQGLTRSVPSDQYDSMM